MARSTNISILNIVCDPLTIAEANDEILKLSASHKDKSHYVVKPYVEFAMKAHHDTSLQTILNQADLVLADGVSMQWAASYLYGQPQHRPLQLLRSLVFWIQKMSWVSQVLPERMSGISQTKPLLQMCVDTKKRVGIIGGPANTADTQQNIQHLFQGIDVQVWSGYFDPKDEDTLVQEIAAAKLNILFVAMGFPKQEQFIAKHLNDDLANVLIGEGGSFDYKELGGSIARAPHFVQTTKLEWLWRLLRQPKRITRQLTIPQFIYQIYKYKKQIR